MRQPGEPMSFGLAIARELVHCGDDEWPDKVGSLLINRELSCVVREINALLSDPQHRAEAASALNRIGLWDQLAPLPSSREYT
jgi:hypothetical protein